MALGRPVSGDLVGQPGVKEVWLTVTVVPMGWLSAADLMQEACRTTNLVRSGLDPRSEVRPRTCLPAGRVFHQTYLDNFDALEIVSRAEKDFLQSRGGPGDTVRAAGAALGVSYNDNEKRKIRELHGELLGAVLDGDRGTIGVLLAVLSWSSDGRGLGDSSPVEPRKRGKKGVSAVVKHG